MNLTEAAQAMLEFCAQDAILLSDDLTQAEEAILMAARKIGAKALELQMSRQRLGYEGTRRPCPCGQAQSRRAGMEHRPKTLATQMGSITIHRAYYHCRDCGRSAVPYDRRIGLGGGCESVGLAQAATLLGIHDTFANASATLFRLTGQRLSEATIERLTEAVGGVVAQSEATTADGMRDWQVPPVPARRDRRRRCMCWSTAYRCIRTTAGTRPAAGPATGMGPAVRPRSAMRCVLKRRRNSCRSCVPARRDVVAGWRKPSGSCCWVTARSGSGSRSAGC